jgi:ribonuclease T2
MNRRSKSSGKLTSVQMLGVIVILICISGYEAWQKSQPSVAEPAGATPSQGVVRPTATVEVQTAKVQTVETQTIEPSAPVPVEIQGSSFGDFDYFLLALSWSPDYCLTSGNDDPQQCAIGKKLGFVLHGLWPQNNLGYPSNCSKDPMPAAVKAQFPGLYPNDALYTHEWEKHGTCSGVSAKEYLSFTQRLKQSVQIPEAYQSPEKPFRSSATQIKADFSSANSGFSADVFEPSCSGSGRYLKELYVCFSKEGQAVACSAEVHKTALKSCQGADFLVRNTR